MAFCIFLAALAMSVSAAASGQCASSGACGTQTSMLLQASSARWRGGGSEAKYERYDKACWDAGDDMATRDASCKGDLVCARAGHEGRNCGDCFWSHCCSIQKDSPQTSRPQRKEVCDTPVQGDAMQTWLAWLQNPPCEASEAAKELASRADQLVNTLNYDQVPSLGDVDLVIAGSSYLDRWYVGFSMILNRVKDDVARVRRISGASSGANAPIDMMLMGEEPALTKFLTYGLLGDRFSHVRWFGVMDQSYWFRSAEWLFGKYGSQASIMNDKMHVWMSCSGGKKVLSKFDDARIAERAYRATGSVSPAVDVSGELRGCTDGGVGKVFDDGLRPQITISPTKALGMTGALTGYTLEEYADGVRQGQEAAIKFLKHHTAAHDAVILCPRGASCKDPSM